MSGDTTALGSILGLGDRVKYWECPSCGFQSTSTDGLVYGATHACPRHHGLQAMMVRVSSNGGLKRGTYEHRVNVRGDYVGREQGLIYDPDGRPIMSVELLKPDGGNDLRIFAPCAVASMRDYR